MATILGTFEYTGGSLAGNQQVEEGDEFDRKTQVRKDYRQPGAQTIEQLGEGRGKSDGYSSRHLRKLMTQVSMDRAMLSDDNRRSRRHMASMFLPLPRRPRECSV